MVNSQLTDFITRSRAAGQTDEQIVSTLMRNRWAEVDIRDTFASLNGGQGIPLNTSCSALENQTEPSYTYAGFWTRFVAMIIDTIFFVGVGFLLPENLQFLVGAALLVYTVVMLKRFDGATLGKRVMGIKVVSATGGSLTIGQILLREVIGKFISNITCFIGFVIVVFTKKKQALHDMIANTVVISVR